MGPPFLLRRGGAARSLTRSQSFLWPTAGRFTVFHAPCEFYFDINTKSIDQFVVVLAKAGFIAYTGIK